MHISTRNKLKVFLDFPFFSFKVPEGFPFPMCKYLFCELLNPGHMKAHKMF